MAALIGEHSNKWFRFDFGGLFQPTSKRDIERIYYYFMKSLERIEYNNR